MAFLNKNNHWNKFKKKYIYIYIFNKKIKMAY